MKTIQKIERAILVACTFFVFVSVLRMCVALWFEEAQDFSSVVRLLLFYGVMGLLMGGAFILLFGKKK